jgi:hypothetical protein
MIFLSFSLSFGLLAMVHRVLDSKFKFCTFLLSLYSSRGRLRNQVAVPWFDCDESLTCRGLNSNLKHFGCFTFIFVSCGESHLLVSWCAGDRCDMADSDEDSSRSRRLGVED